ncbi:murein DD-endopeptidase MepM/ murein hydrolase activator NlpD [Oleiagrimonas soli]|uniref:Murein DD-endopeptidase MepM/ murein hydrolase activator NlpD n=1 Tax=Oleiagrimonas soli TaxID=1543381 RepID=A0A841KF40_9GAMM|nr:murein DD-endopeptidase MepM/ murein hydrolase activator NlpD [Oleiagrimonas soli]
MRLRHLLAASALLLPLPQARAAVLQLPREVPQGGLVIGRAPAACRVSYDGRDLRVGADGRFAFGVGRDAEGPLQVRSACPGHPPQVQHIAVRSRTWPTERVNGVPPKTVRPPPAIAARMARERKLVAAARTRNDAREDFEEGFVWPVHGRISGRFGSQRIYNGVPRAPHSGVDIAVPRGTPVKAPAAGIVTLAKRLYLSGNTVIIDHGFGVSSVMLHMDKLDVTPGQRVRQGQIVGLSGMTGRATGPHVHWGMNWFGVRLDPRMVAREHPANTHRQARRKSAQTAD